VRETLPARLPRGRRLADFGSSQALRILESIEGEVAARLPTPPSPARLHRSGDWLVRRDLLLARALAPLVGARARPEWEASIAPLRTRGAALAFGLRARPVASTARAAAAVFHTHLRAFYGGARPLTLWIGLGKLRVPDLAGAAPAREQFGSPPGVRVPRVVQADLAAQPPYFLEELVVGRPFTAADWPLVSDRLLPALFAYYPRVGIRQRPVSEVYDRERLLAPIAALRGESAMQPIRRDLDDLLAQASGWLAPSPMTLPCSLGHGDLSRSNFLVAPDGALVLLDWERAKPLPLAADLIKLVEQHPPLRPGIEDWLASQTESARGLAPVAQLRLAALEILAHRATWRTGEDSGRLGRFRRQHKLKRMRAWLGFAQSLASQPPAGRS
jgi:hypothetical protein